MRLRFAPMVAVSLVATAAPGQTPPPTFVQMPYLGLMDSATGLLRSFDSGKQPVGTSPAFREWFYQFYLDASVGQELAGSVLTGGATIEVQDADHRTLGPLAGPLPKLASGTYYVHVTGGPASFHFGVLAKPRLADYPNDAGHTRDTALNLGNLTSTINHTNSFYTIFPPQQIAGDSRATGALARDFDNPVPYPPALDWYQFTLPGGATVKLEGDVVRNPGETYVLLTPDGSSAWQKGQSRFLPAGTYWLAVADQMTQFIGDGPGFTRNARVENFEHYQFRLVLAPGGQPGGPASADLTATLLSINTNLGMGGAASRVTAPGGTVMMSFRVNNNGPTPSGAGHYAIYISKTPQITQQSRFVVYGSYFEAVPAFGGTSDQPASIVLPADLAPGDYFMIVVANYDKTVNETNFNNNASNPVPITIR